MNAMPQNAHHDPRRGNPTSRRFSRARMLLRGLLLAVLAEGATLATRFGAGITAEEFNSQAPLVLQIHHMFWAVPLLGVTAILWSRPTVAEWLCALALACVASDLAHHFVVLPAAIGETGWHWP